MSANVGAPLVAAAFVFATGFYVGGLVGISKGTYDTKQEAIQARVAEWTINPETGERTFKWKTPPPISP